jgi:hypothetical protein
MEKVNDLADQVGVSCYLGCLALKKGFYEKMGYRVLSRQETCWGLQYEYDREANNNGALKGAF